MKYNVYCKELEEFTSENTTWNEIKEFAFEMMKDRSDSPYAEKDCPLSLELTEIVNKDIENLDDEYTKDFLLEYGYEVTLSK